MTDDEEYWRKYPHAAMSRELRKREAIKKAQGETKFEKVQYLSGTLNPEIKKGLTVTVTGSEIRIDPRKSNSRKWVHIVF